MEPSLWKKVDKLFNEAVGLQPEERQQFILDACGGDEDLQSEVEKLLDSFAHLSDDFLEAGHRERMINELGGSARGNVSLESHMDQKSEKNKGLLTALSLWSVFNKASNASPHVEGRQDVETPKYLGSFQLLETLGDGGMGVVYKAIQNSPVKRTVAIKVLRHALSPSARSRFHTEAQTLSRLSEHPFIATFFEVGETETKLPYLVMELIPGEAITRYCDIQKLSLEKRIRLFLKVCEGISHAHINGVIHRDIKPSNILIMNHGKAIPKIIDFGVAKIIDPDLMGQDKPTSAHMLLGTPQYMSPEQAMASKTIDTRSDIYALGVLLYELICGFPPYQMPAGESNPLSLSRMIASQDPIPISKRLPIEDSEVAEIARRRDTTESTLKRTLKQDLNWITLKALQKEPGNRYQTVDALVSDLEAFMSQRPVQARAPSTWYYLVTFARRRKVTLLAITIIILTFAANLYFANKNLAVVRSTKADLKSVLEKTEKISNERKKIISYLTRHSQCSGYPGHRR